MPYALMKSLSTGSGRESILLNKSCFALFYSQKEEVCTSMTSSISWPKGMEGKIVWQVNMAGRVEGIKSKHSATLSNIKKMGNLGLKFWFLFSVSPFFFSFLPKYTHSLVKIFWSPWLPLCHGFHLTQCFCVSLLCVTQLLFFSCMFWVYLIFRIWGEPQVNLLTQLEFAA